MKQTNRVRKNGNTTTPAQQTQSARVALSEPDPQWQQITIELPSKVMAEVNKATVDRNNDLPEELHWDTTDFIRNAIQRECNRQLRSDDPLSNIENAVWQSNGLMTALIRVLVDISDSEIIPKNTEVYGLSILCDETKAKLSDAFNRTHAYALGKAGGAQ